MADHGEQVLADAEVDAAQLDAAVYAALDGDHDLVREALLGADAADHVVGDAGAEVDDAARVELLAAAAGDELALVEGRGLDGGLGDAELAHVGGVEVDRGGHAVVLLRVGADHDLVDEDARDGDVLGVDGAGLGNLADLGDHLTAVALGGKDRVEDLELHGLVGGGEVAHLVADGAADEADVDRHLVVEHVLLAVDLDDLGDVGQGLGAVVHLAALDARVDEGAEADLAHLAGKAAGHRAVELRDLALGQAVGLDLVVCDHVHPARLEAPVGANDARDEALVGEVLDAALAVGLAAGVQQCEVARVAGGKEALLDGLEV